jgi:hypothetical protein
MVPPVHQAAEETIQNRQFCITARRHKHRPCNALEAGILCLPRDIRTRHGYLDGLYPGSGSHLMNEKCENVAATPHYRRVHSCVTSLRPSYFANP